jgi:predicted enzyme related to lactoylglutathione lyase
MGQPVAWFEIISPDAERAKKFYSEIFFTDPDGNQVGLWA